MEPAHARSEPQAACHNSPSPVLDSHSHQLESLRELLDHIQDPVPAKSSAVPPATSTTAPPATGPLFEDEQEVVFRLKDSSGNPPILKLFDKSFAQRKLAAKMNQAAIDEETDPKRKKKMRANEYLELEFAGLVLKRNSKDEEQIDVTLVGRTQEVALGRTISKADLLAGKTLTLDWPDTKKSKYGITAIAKAQLVLRLDPETQQIQIQRAWGKISVETIVKTFADDGEISGTGTIEPKLERKPLRSYD